jgi:membrane dipeptidase
MSVNWIDGHLDLAHAALRGRDLCLSCSDEDGCVSLPDLRAGGVRLAFATIFIEPGVMNGDPWGYPGSDDLDAAHAAGVRQLEVYERLADAGEIAIVHDVSQLDSDKDTLKVVLLMEGADPIRSPDEAGWWFERGVRIVGLTWSMGTRYAGGNASPGPLTSAGRDLVAALDELGIVHDVSHLADEAFDELMQLAAPGSGRIVATHSNCRALLESKQRHLRDDQIKRIAQRGGIVGLNLYGRFLSTSDRGGGRATIANAVAHVERVCGVMRHRRGVALGSDMDGGFTPRDLPEGLDHPTKLHALADALRNRGWSEQDVAGFAHDNWINLLGQALPAAGGAASRCNGR